MSPVSRNNQVTKRQLTSQPWCSRLFSLAVSLFPKRVLHSRRRTFWALGFSDNQNTLGMKDTRNPDFVKRKTALNGIFFLSAISPKKFL